MILLGALINALEAALGGALGLIFNQRISSKLSDFLLKGQGLCVILVAVQGMVKGGDIALATVSVALGSLIGYYLDLEGLIHRFGDWVQGKLDRVLKQKEKKRQSFSTGFVNASLFCCTGAMAIVGSLSSGMQLDHSTLIAKGLIDLVVCIPMAASLGIGVPFCGLSLLVYEGLLSLLASYLAPFLSSLVINEMVVVGSLLLLAVGTNLLDITKIKVANMLPAAFLPAVLLPLLQLFT